MFEHDGLALRVRCILHPLRIGFSEDQRVAVDLDSMSLGNFQEEVGFLEGVCVWLWVDKLGLEGIFCSPGSIPAAGGELVIGIVADKGAKGNCRTYEFGGIFLIGQLLECLRIGFWGDGFEIID